VAELDDRPFPPGPYPVVVLGSGPGGLQLSYALSRLGVDHALLSADDRPAGMFRRFPFFQRLISWSKPYALVERGTRWYERFDWNSLVSDDPNLAALVPGFMDGTSYFPSRAEMQRGLEAFAERGGIRIRHGCRWEATRREDEGTYVVSTTDGEYRTATLVVAVGMTEPWKPSDIDGMADVPHYVETDNPEAYADRSVFIVGKRNSGFEIADGLLPWARQVILASPRPARLSILVQSVAAARARYMQPYEDHVLGGGTFVLDAALERIERTADGYRVHATGTTAPGARMFEMDRVIAATGFGTPLRDLGDVGVDTFFQGRLPTQTPFWESPGAPGVFFAGSITQGSIGLKKYGRPGGSASVHGFRYNARVLAEHLARTRFGIDPQRPRLEPDDVIPFLIREMAAAPELWHQQAYLARVVSADRDRGIVDEGILPLQHFVDVGGPDAVAATVETDEHGTIRPAVYLRRANRVTERTLDGDPLLDFATAEHRKQLADAVEPIL
jgi:thioredoxin reductase